MKPSATRNLVVLVADKNIEFAIRGLLSRPTSLGIQAITFDVFPHPERDPGCFLRGHEFVRPFQYSHARALVVFDRHGSGRQDLPRSEIENIVESRLAGSGWQGRAHALAIDPELEQWVWADSPHVDRVLGWAERTPSLQSWLLAGNWIQAGATKPSEPKAAMEAALRLVKKPRSAALYQDLAGSVSFSGCTDPAFLKLRNVLAAWFPLAC